jgi:hypothetical protein
LQAVPGLLEGEDEALKESHNFHFPGPRIYLVASDHSQDGVDSVWRGQHPSERPPDRLFRLESGFSPERVLIDDEIHVTVELLEQIAGIV